MSGISIFNKNDRERINEETKKAREERNKFDSRPLLDPALPHVLVVTEMETGSWKPKDGKGEVFTIQFTMEPVDKTSRENTKPLVQRWNIHSSEDCSFDIELGVKMFIDFLSGAYQVEGIPESSGMADLLTKLKKFIEVPFRAAVRHRERLWKKQSEDGTIEPIITREAQLYYASSIDDQTFRGTKADKRIIKMKADEKEEYDQLVNKQTGKEPTQVSNVSFDLPPEEDGTTQDLNDDPFK